MQLKKHSGTIRHGWTRCFPEVFASLPGTVLVLGLAMVAPGGRCAAQVSVLTQHNDIGRTGQNVHETSLSPANATPAAFGKLFTRVVDGVIYAQPLYMQNVTIPTKGTHNVVFVATENDTVYAFDADTNGGIDGVPLWVASLTTPAHGAAPGATAVPSIDIGEDISPTIGITGTPVIDPANGTLYVVSFSKEKGAYVLRLHALKITSGQEQKSSPATIEASVAGTGNGSSDGKLTFDPMWENQRPGLLLLDGVVYIGFAAHGDQGPWHGWVLAYSEAYMTQVAAYCASPGGVGSGFWMSGAGLAADTDDASADPMGRLFVVTGNGDFSATSAAQTGADFGDSVLKLSLQKSALAVGDSFTPSNQQSLDTGDGDLGAGGAVVIPDTDATTHLLLQAGKEGKIYLLNRENLGSYHTPDQVVQELANGTTSSSWGAGLWGLPAYWNKTVYYPGRNAPLQAFALRNGLLSTTPTSTTTELLSYPAPTPSVSANGTENGLVWLLEASNADAPGAVLEAYEATNLQKMTFSSQTNASRDGLGAGVKFAIPTVANGKVYAASTATNASSGAVYGQLSVFGLLAGMKTAQTPVFDPEGEAFTPPLAVTITDGTPDATIYYTTDGSIPSAVSTRYTGPVKVESNLTLTAIASAAGYLQSAAASAIYTSKTQVPDPTISAGTGIYTNTVAVTLHDSSTAASIYYTTDGSTPTAKSNLYKGQFSITPADTTTVTLNVIALASGLTASNVISRQYQINVEGTSINCGGTTGFTTTGCTMTLNGGADLDDVRLQLSNGTFNQATSAFFSSQVETSSFTTDFSFQLSNPVADGFTFTLQSAGATAVGSNSGGLGYEKISAKSVALKFDFHNDAGEGTNSTGVYVSGAAPTVPAVNLTGSGINLASTSNDQFTAHLVYTGSTKTLDVTIADATLGNVSWSSAFNVDIQTLIEGNTAYAGFTGSTNANGSSSQKILTWTYAAGNSTEKATAQPVFSLSTSTTYTTPQTVAITSTTPKAVLYYTTDGSQPSTSSNVYSKALTISASTTIQAVAVAPGDLMSPPVEVVYTFSK